MIKTVRWCIGLATMCLLLAGCNASTSGRGVSSGTQTVASATPTIAATATPALQPTISLSQIPAACAPNPYTKQFFVQIGGLIISEVSFGLDYPAAQLPDGTPAKPFKLPNDPSNGSGNEFPGSPPVNPVMKEGPGGFIFSVCNGSSSQTHTLTSVSLQIAAFQPYTGQLNSWQYCDGYYSRQHGAFYGGCGGGLAAQEYLHATYAPTDSVGASVVAAQTGTGAQPDGSSMPPLPAPIKPGVNAEVDLGVTLPTAPGTYTFTFGVSVDNASTVFFSDTTPALFDSSVQKWGGQACDTATMLNQIPPATNPPSYYICPAA